MVRGLHTGIFRHERVPTDFRHSVIHLSRLRTNFDIIEDNLSVGMVNTMVTSRTYGFPAQYWNKESNIGITESRIYWTVGWC